MERPPGEPPAPPVALVRSPDPVQRWRLTLRRRPDAPVVAQREWQMALEASLLASGLPIAVADGPGGRPRIAVASPLAQGMPSDGELVELLLLRRLPVWQVREAISTSLPAGHELAALEDVWLGEPAVAGRVIGAAYELALDAGSTRAVAAAVAAVSAATSLPRQRTRGDRVVDYDLRPFLEMAEIASDAGPVLRMRLRHDPEKGVGRPEEVVAELAERSGVPLDPGRLVRTSLVLAPLKTGGRSSERPAGPRSRRARPAT